MSRSTLYVRFPDGTFRFGIYNGTTDIVIPNLHDTIDAAWDAWRRSAYDWCSEDGSGEPVEVYSDYADGFWWRATATPERITSAFEPDELDLSAVTDGWPEHWPNRADVRR